MIGQYACGYHQSKLQGLLLRRTLRLLFQTEMKKRSEKRKHCAMAVVTFAPPQTPFSGAQDGQNLISWRRSLAAPTDRVW